MKSTARTLLSLVGLAFLSTLPSTGCSDLAGDCHNTLSCPEYAEDGETGGGAGAPGDGDGDGDGDNTGGRSGDGDGDGDGDTGGTGGTTSKPCDDACEGDTPQCEEDTDTCVECLNDNHCDEDGSEPICDSEHGICVGCLDNEDCDDDEAVCETSDKVCVECFSNDDCTDEAAPACDTDNNTCVECVADADCDDPTMPLCGEDNLCAAGCAESTQCERFAPGHAECEAASGTCVECLDESHCSGKVCDPAALTCTGVDAGSAGDCDACQYDAECETGQVCVEMSYNNPTAGVVGSFCLWRMDSTETDAPGGSCGLNSQPYSKQAIVETVDGQTDIDVCRPATTTCQGVKDHRTTKDGACAVPGDDDAVCGAPGFNDAECRQQDPGVDVFCTYSCLGADNRDCPVGSNCVGGYCEI